MDDKGSWQETLTWMLMPVGRLWCQAAGKAYEGLGMTVALGAPVLAVAELGDGARQNLVADEIGVDHAALVRSLDKLESAGFIERRIDPLDRRARTLYLTKDGRALAKKLKLALNRFRAQTLAQISEEEGEIAVKVLRTIANAARDALQGSSEPPEVAKVRTPKKKA